MASLLKAGAVVVAGGACALVAAAPGVASGAPAKPVPAPSCKVPSLSIAPSSGAAGTKVTVTGLNFSGCPTTTGVKATPVITVKVGIATAAKMGEVLATTKTSATGGFTASITIPNVSTGGKPQIEIAAGAMDPATKLNYIALRPFSVTGAGSGGGGGGTNPATPVSVPAGTGGQAATASDTNGELQLAGGAAGIALVGLGAFGLLRRRQDQH